jgi:hypothetical protein
MPNHVTNRLRINATPEQVTEVREAIKGVWEKEPDRPRPFDFGKLIPMPEALNVTSGSESTVAQWEAGYKDHRGRAAYEPPAHIIERANENRELVDKIKENIRVHGYPTWYEWAIAKWGTKWNAYDQAEIEPNFITFDTAWSCPLPVLEALAARFPEVEFVCEFADEDIGSNQGTLTFRDGVLVARTEVEGAKDRRLFAYRVKGYSQEEIDERERERAEWLAEEGRSED